MYVCIHACMYLCIYVSLLHACKYVWMNASLHACIDVCMYVSMHACLHACMHDLYVMRCKHSNKLLEPFPLPLVNNFTYNKESLGKELVLIDTLQ